MSRLLRSALVSIASAALLAGSASAQTMRAQAVATGLSQPLDASSPPGDLNRLFIVEQTGAIRILDQSTGTLQSAAAPFLNISTIITSGGERGLLGLAFHPDYANNGRFYVNYTNLSGNTVIAQYTANAPFATSTTANAGSAVILRTITQDFANHNGGHLAFGPDGMLYIGMGDGGSANDPNGRAQDDGQLLGKILRLDVNDTSAADGDGTYIPDNNPHRGAGNPLDEIWAKGMRNPWRLTFDRANGNLWIADVGQDAQEEVDFQPAPVLSVPGDGNSAITNAAAIAGRNYGWRCMEGTACTGLTGCTCNSVPLTLPVLSVPQAGTGFCSITGGVVYRGAAIPSIQGQYFFSDYCAGVIRSFPATGASTTYAATTNWTSQLGGISGIVGFAEDGAGEMFIISINGTVYKVVPPECGCPCTVTNADTAFVQYNCETDAGWTVTAPTTGAATDGLWQRGVPVNAPSYAYEPASDSDGSGAAWVTENSDPGAATTSDVDGGTTILLSPQFDFVNGGGGNPGGEVIICYDYYNYLTIDTEGVDGLFVEVSSNGTAGPWTRIASHTTTNANTWTPHVITDAMLVTAGVTKTANMRLRFLAVDAGTPSITECGLDNFKLYRRIPITDCNGNNIDDAIDIANSTSQDCNNNAIPDECDIANGAEDFDGGPTGIRAAGDTFFNTSCFGCHGPNGTGAAGPNIRNKSRTAIRNRLTLTVLHPGGGFPGATDQDFANLEAYLADGGSRGRPDRIPDSCQGNLPDCDNDSINDGKELELATQVDADYNGVPDSCEIVICAADLDDGSGTGTPDNGVDINDLLYFLACFEAGGTCADLDNGSGTGIPDAGVDINDLLFFLDHFEAGC